jgi:hypothetical protein
MLNKVTIEEILKINLFCFQKLIISLSILLVAETTMAFPQASFYATNMKDTYPQVLPRFAGVDTNIDNRFGENNPSTSSAAPATSWTDVLYDPDVVSRVATWPKERQPFWYLNSQHINTQRGQNIPCSNCINQDSLQRPFPRSPFARN